MASDIKLRPFAAEEWPLYKALRLRALLDSPYAFGRTYAEEADRSDVEWSRRMADIAASPLWFSSLAFLHGNPVGFVFARMTEDASPVVHLYSMWVDASARQCGVGRRIVESAIEWARAKRAKEMLLQVTESNTAAIALYKRLGFLVTSNTELLRADSTLISRTMRLSF